MIETMREVTAAVLQNDPETGPRLKHYSQSADVHYWTALWQNVDLRFYDRSKRGHLPHQLRDTFLRWVQPGARVLEAGCGLGHFTVATRARGYETEGLDWSEPTISTLRAQFPDIPWHVGDVRHLEFADAAFDAVYSPGVCEHFVEGPRAVLVETARILRPGGIAVVSTPCFNKWLERRADLLFSSNGVADLSFHEYAFTPEGLGRLLRLIGFEILQIRLYGALNNMMRYAGWRVPGPVVTPIAFAMDYIPLVRSWGSTCLWVVRKR